MTSFVANRWIQWGRRDLRPEGRPRAWCYQFDLAGEIAAGARGLPGGGEGRGPPSRRGTFASSRCRVRSEPAVAVPPLVLDLGQRARGRRRRGRGRAAGSCRSRRSAPRAAGPTDPSRPRGRSRRARPAFATRLTRMPSSRAARSQATAASIEASTPRVRRSSATSIKYPTMPTLSWPRERDRLVAPRAGAAPASTASCCAHQAVRRAVDAHLGGQHDLEPARGRPARGLAALVGDERERRRAARHVAQQAQHADHRAVVERDVPRVVVAQREELRPAAVRVLRGQEEREAARERGLDVAAARSRRARAPGTASA